MNAQLRAAFILLGMLLLTLFHARRSAGQSPLDVAALDRFIAAQMRAQRIPGLALAITHGDQVILVKGYGDTHERGREKYETLMALLPKLRERGEAARELAGLRKAGLSDESGEALKKAVASLSASS